MRKKLIITTLSCGLCFFSTARAFVFFVTNNWPNTSIEAIVIGASTYQLPPIKCGDSTRKIDAQFTGIRGATISLQVRFYGCLSNYNLINLPVILSLPSDSGKVAIAFCGENLSIRVMYSTGVYTTGDHTTAISPLVGETTVITGK